MNTPTLGPQRDFDAVDDEEQYEEEYDILDSYRNEEYIDEEWDNH